MTEPPLIAIRIPLKTISAPNIREHHYIRARRVKRERFAVGMVLNTYPRPALPCAVLLTRCSPHHQPLDDDNLRGALKAVRDEVARWLQVDDGDLLQVTWVYHQETRSEWAVTIMAQADDDAGGSNGEGEEDRTQGQPVVSNLQGQGLGADELRVAHQVPRLLQAPANGRRH